MDIETWSDFLINIKNGIKNKMEECGLNSALLASSANLGTNTVQRLVNGLTFRPSLRTAVSCSVALGADLELWERAMFVQKKEPKVARTVGSLRRHMRKIGFEGIVIDRKEDGLVINFRNKNFQVRNRPVDYPLEAWTDFALTLKRSVR